MRLNGGRLSAAQRTRLARRWLAIQVRARTRAFTPLIFSIVLLAFVSLLARYRTRHAVEAEFFAIEHGLVGLHGRLVRPMLSREQRNSIGNVCYNLTASSMLTDRLLPLRAPLVCKDQWYIASRSVNSLPRAVVVIAAPSGTPGSAVVRTVRSVLHRSAPALLAKIIVSTCINALQREILISLRQLPKTRVLQAHFCPPHHHDPWLAIAGLRDVGARHAHTSALVFLTAGTEMGANWLRPLLSEIVEDGAKNRRASLVLPAVHVLNARTLELPKRSNVRNPILGHDWALHPVTLFRSRTSNSASRIASPLLPGQDFAVSSHFFRKIGGIDSRGRTEFAIRVWLCGGSVVSVPCATVAMTPACTDRDGPDARFRRLAAAEMWMGRYAFLARLANDAPVSVPDTVHRTKCASFDSYLRVAFPELQASADRLLGRAEVPKAWGKLRSGTGSCIALVEDEFLMTPNCAEGNVMLFSDAGLLVAAPKMTAACMTRENGRLLARICTYEERETQLWEVARAWNTSLVARSDGAVQCLTAEEGESLALRPCGPKTNEAQRWTWQYYSKLMRDGSATVEEDNKLANAGSLDRRVNRNDIFGRPGLTGEEIGGRDSNEDI